MSAIINERCGATSNRLSRGFPRTVYFLAALVLPIHTTNCSRSNYNHSPVKEVELQKDILNEIRQEIVGTTEANDKSKIMRHSPGRRSIFYIVKNRSGKETLIVFKEDGSDPKEYYPDERTIVYKEAWPIGTWYRKLVPISVNGIIESVDKYSEYCIDKDGCYEERYYTLRSNNMKEYSLIIPGKWKRRGISDYYELGDY